MASNKLTNPSTIPHNVRFKDLPNREFSAKGVGVAAFGQVLEAGIEAADTVITSNIQQDVQDAADSFQQGVLGASSTGDPAPGDISAFTDDARKTKAAVAGGRWSVQQGEDFLAAKMRQLNRRYAGPGWSKYRQTIATAFQNTTGRNPIQAQISRAASAQRGGRGGSRVMEDGYTQSQHVAMDLKLSAQGILPVDEPYRDKMSRLTQANQADLKYTDHNQKHQFRKENDEYKEKDEVADLRGTGMAFVKNAMGPQMKQFGSDFDSFMDGTMPDEQRAGFLPKLKIARRQMKQGLITLWTTPTGNVAPVSSRVSPKAMNEEAEAIVALQFDPIINGLNAKDQTVVDFVKGENDLKVEEATAELLGADPLVAYSFALKSLSPEAADVVMALPLGKKGVSLAQSLAETIKNRVSGLAVAAQTKGGIPDTAAKIMNPKVGEHIAETHRKARDIFTSQKTTDAEKIELANSYFGKKNIDMHEGWKKDQQGLAMWSVLTPDVVSELIQVDLRNPGSGIREQLDKYVAQNMISSLRTNWDDLRVEGLEIIFDPETVEFFQVGADGRETNIIDVITGTGRAESLKNVQDAVRGLIGYSDIQGRDTGVLLKKVFVGAEVIVSLRGEGPEVSPQEGQGSGSGEGSVVVSQSPLGDGQTGTRQSLSEADKAAAQPEGATTVSPPSVTPETVRRLKNSEMREMLRSGDLTAADEKALLKEVKARQAENIKLGKELDEIGRPTR